MASDLGYFSICPEGDFKIENEVVFSDCNA